MVADFSPVSGLSGGALVGLAAVLLMLANGRIAGVSGIVGGLLTPGSHAERRWRLAFVAGLVLGAALYAAMRGQMFSVTPVASTPLAIVAGLLVGFGTRMAGGCTSGHGVCGVARLSPRSLLATVVFMIAGAGTVYLTHHLVRI